MKQFSQVKVLIIGDVMLDRYWWGEVSRISPEAPVPVVRLVNSTYSPGGAANVAANISGLGATPYLVGIVGSDEAAALIPSVFETAGVSDEHLIRVPGRQTTVKTRVVAHSQQIARIDQETGDDLDETVEQISIERIGKLMRVADSVVVSDYAKGFLTRTLLSEIIELAKGSGKPVLVDPKGKDYTKYKGAALLTPNKKEAADSAGFDIHERDVISRSGEKLMAELAVDSLLITQGEDGMTLFQRDESPVHLSSQAREVYDVTGAGDTVIAVLGTAIGAGESLHEAANLANIAAGIVVGQIGTSRISIGQLPVGSF